MKDGIIVTISALLLGSALIAFAHGCKSNRKEITHMVEAKADTGRRWTDDDSIRHFTKMVEEGNMENVEALHKQQMDSVCRLLNLARKQVSGITTAQAQVSGRVEAPLVQVTPKDTIQGLPVGWEGNRFTWSDSFTHIEGYVDIAHKELCVDSLTGKADTCEVPGKAIVFYKVDVPIKYVTYWRRKHKVLWFRVGRKIYYMDISSKNPNAEILNFEAIQINK